ncbi:MAG: hypothetical protein GY751_04605 [Bacteroidetes bacterium]|nr:hypothetical protein [Bacteroidota bacterium]
MLVFSALNCTEIACRAIRNTNVDATLVDITDDTGELTLDEEVMLDTLPDYNERYRLSCQINVDSSLDGLRIQYIAV